MNITSSDLIIMYKYKGMDIQDTMEMTGCSRGYINTIIKRNYNDGFIDRMNMKWMNRMRKSLVRGEMIYNYQFHEFIKSDDGRSYIKFCHSGGAGKVSTCEAWRLLKYWANYFTFYDGF